MSCRNEQQLWVYKADWCWFYRGSFCCSSSLCAHTLTLTLDLNEAQQLSYTQSEIMYNKKGERERERKGGGGWWVCWFVEPYVFKSVGHFGGPRMSIIPVKMYPFAFPFLGYVYTETIWRENAKVALRYNFLFCI